MDNLSNQKEHSLMKKMLPKLKQGEASCIAIALCRGMVFVSDDWKAREIAAEKGIPFSGTLGILKICLNDGIISLAEGNRILNTMINKGYYSPN